MDGMNTSTEVVNATSRMIPQSEGGSAVADVYGIESRHNQIEESGTERFSVVV